MANNDIRLTEIAKSSFEWMIPRLTSYLKKEYDVYRSVYEFCDGPWRLSLFRCRNSIELSFEKADIFVPHLKEVVVRASVEINGGDIRFHLPEKMFRSNRFECTARQRFPFPWVHVGERDNLKISLSTECILYKGELSDEEDEELPLKRKHREDYGKFNCRKKKFLRVSGVDKLRENMKELLASDDDKDVTIEVKDHQFRAHKSILRARAPVFFSMFSHNMVEKNSGKILITDCEPAAFQQFLVYLYTGELKDVIPENIVFSLYYIGDKYLVKGVKKICASFIPKYLTVETFRKVVTLSLLHNDSELLDTAAKFFVENFREISATEQWESLLEEQPEVGNDLHILVGFHSAVADLDVGIYDGINSYLIMEEQVIAL